MLDLVGARIRGTVALQLGAVFVVLSVALAALSLATMGLSAEAWALGVGRLARLCVAWVATALAPALPAAAGLGGWLGGATLGARGQLRALALLGLGPSGVLRICAPLALGWLILAFTAAFVLEPAAWRLLTTSRTAGSTAVVLAGAGQGHVYPLGDGGALLKEQGSIRGIVGDGTFRFRAGSFDPMEPTLHDLELDGPGGQWTAGELRLRPRALRVAALPAWATPTRTILHRWREGEASPRERMVLSRRVAIGLATPLLFLVMLCLGCAFGGIRSRTWAPGIWAAVLLFGVLVLPRAAARLEPSAFAGLLPLWLALVGSGVALRIRR